MTNEPTKADILRRQDERERKDGEAAVKQGGNPSPAGQDEPRNKDVSKKTI